MSSSRSSSVEFLTCEAAPGLPPLYPGPPATPSVSSSSSGYDVECFSCRQLGHFARDCPMWRGKCFRCKQDGHHSSVCTFPDVRFRSQGQNVFHSLTDLFCELRALRKILQPQKWAWRTLRQRPQVTHFNPPQTVQAQEEPRAKVADEDGEEFVVMDVVRLEDDECRDLPMGSALQRFERERVGGEKSEEVVGVIQSVTDGAVKCDEEGKGETVVALASVLQVEADRDERKEIGGVAGAAQVASVGVVVVEGVNIPPTTERKRVIQAGPGDHADVEAVKCDEGVEGVTKVTSAREAKSVVEQRGVEQKAVVEKVPMTLTEVCIRTLEEILSPLRDFSKGRSFKIHFDRRFGTDERIEAFVEKIGEHSTVVWSGRLQYVDRRSGCVVYLFERYSGIRKRSDHDVRRIFDQECESIRKMMMEEIVESDSMIAKLEVDER